MEGWIDKLFLMYLPLLGKGKDLGLCLLQHFASISTTHQCYCLVFIGFPCLCCRKWKSKQISPHTLSCSCTFGKGTEMGEDRSLSSNWTWGDVEGWGYLPRAGHVGNTRAKSVIPWELFLSIAKLLKNNFMMSLQPVIGGKGHWKKNPSALGLTELSLWTSFWAQSCRWAVSLILGEISGAGFFFKCRHTQALPNSTESSSSWNKVFPVNVLVFKCIFFLLKQCTALGIWNSLWNWLFFIWSTNLFNSCIYYTCFWKDLSVSLQTNLCPSSLKFLFLQSEELLLFWVEPA